jgi:hypothetical protein
LHYTEAFDFPPFSFERTATENPLKLIGCLLLVSGFFIVVGALVLMYSIPSRLGFVAAGFGVEMLGLTLLMNAHKAIVKEQR